MSTRSLSELKEETRRLRQRLDEKFKSFDERGVMRASEREAVANWKLRHLAVTDAMDGSETDSSAEQFERDVKALKLSFERWIARIDKRSARGRSMSAGAGAGGRETGGPDSGGPDTASR